MERYQPLKGHLALLAAPEALEMQEGPAEATAATAELAA